MSYSTTGKCYFPLMKRFYSTMTTLTINDILRLKPIDQKVTIQGWVQAVREYKDLYFVDLIDGTCIQKLQILISNKSSTPVYGTSVKVEGSITKSSHKSQEIELSADSWSLIGACPSDYPFQCHQKYSSEFIRQFPHLRPKIRSFSSLLRIRNHASMAVHKFFQDDGFCFLHTPIITQNDCEGAGETFTIEANVKPDTKIATEYLSPSTETIQSTSTNIVESEKLDPNHFFGAPAYLTVSGQLHLEAVACALTRVYNFGPTFRAESSHSRLHASEFQMIEAEVAFVESVEDLIKLVDKCIKAITQILLENCSNDVNFLCQDHKKHNVYLQKMLAQAFKILTYTEAFDILEKNKNSLKVPFQFGEDFSTEHKLFLVNHCGNLPIFISMFPSSLKPFYMKTNTNKMDCCFDLFAPYGGEVCGGGLREENAEILRKKYSFEENNSLSWYLDLRKYGTVPHGGFGIGFERLLQTILGISNIRDVIPFPRRKYDCKC